MIRDYDSVVSLLFVFLIIVSTFFIRGWYMPLPFASGISMSWLIPVFVVTAGLYLLLVNKELRLPNSIIMLIGVYTIAGFCSFTYNIIIYDSTVAPQFLLEYMLGPLILVVVANLSVRADLDVVFSILLYTGLVFAGVVLYMGLIEAEEVRRVGTGDQLSLPIGVNHLSHGLGAASVVSVTRMFTRDSTIYPLYLTAFFISMLLTGTRSVLVAVIISSIFIMYLQDDRTLPSENTFFNTHKILSIFAVFSIATITLFILNNIYVDISSGLHRRLFSTSSFIQSIEGRIFRYTSALTSAGSSLLSLLFGIGFHNYIVLAEGDIEILPPHHIWFSSLAYVGLPSAISFILLHVYLLKSSLADTLKINSEKEIVTLAILIVVSLYSFMSGRLTRIITIWVIMGVISGMLIYNNSHTNSYYN